MIETSGKKTVNFCKKQAKYDRLYATTLSSLFSPVLLPERFTH
ncbi:hypothetical protein [Mannheimia granulomatis]|nr:hypothetical protein [Mannheimia granulomatis]